MQTFYDPSRPFSTDLVAAGLGLLLAGALAPRLAQAQTPVTTVVNSSSDTTLQVGYNGSLLAPGTLVTDGTENDSIPAEGAGVRMMWYPAKAAFRAGRVGGDFAGDKEWNADSIGVNSAAFGSSAQAGGAASLAAGFSTTAAGSESVAFGDHTIARTSESLSIGECNSANRSNDGTLLVAGNGTQTFGSCDSRSNALVLDELGNLSISGDLTLPDGSIRDNSNGITVRGNDILRLTTASDDGFVSVDAAGEGFLGIGTTDPSPAQNSTNLHINDGRPRISFNVSGSGDDATIEFLDDGTLLAEITWNGGSGVEIVRNLSVRNNLDVGGDLNVSGNKNFVQSVDTDEGEKDVVYTSMEAPTARTEISGVAELEDGRAEIALPDHFEWVTDGEEPLIVQVTPHAREPVRPQVTERSTGRIVIEDFSEGTGDYEVSYTVKGTRDGHADKEVVREPAAER